MKFLWAFPVLLLVCVLAAASPCGTVYFPQQSYVVQQQKVHHAHHDYADVKKVLVLEYQLIPTYPIGLAAPYTAPYTAPQASTASPCDAKIAALEASLETLRKLVAGSTPATPGTTPPGTLPATAPLSRTPILNNHCGGCHGKDEASNKGRGLNLFGEDGNLLKLDDKTYGSVLRVLSDGSMPKAPSPKLSPEGFTGAIQELVNVHSK